MGVTRQRRNVKIHPYHDMSQRCCADKVSISAVISVLRTVLLEKSDEYYRKCRNEAVSVSGLGRLMILESGLVLGQRIDASKPPLMVEILPIHVISSPLVLTKEYLR